MKSTFIQSLIFAMFTTYICYADNRNENNPGISLNPQDVPIFYENNPLSGMKAFTVISSFSLKDTNIQKRIENSVVKTLETVGEVIHLKDNDMRGFGAGNLLLFQIGNITEFNGKETSISRLSLSIETPVTLEKTKMKTFPMVWSINTFLQGPIDSNSESTLMKAIYKLMGEFVQNYQYVNQDQKKRPVFYIYD